MYQAVTEQTLENTVKRVIRFLRAVASRADIRGIMGSVGYDGDEQKQGWELVAQVCGTRPVKFVDDHDDEVRSAIAELDATDEPLFRRAHAALGRLHPEQDAFVFDGLAPARGPEAVVGVSTFLDRIDALENASERKATRRADAAAVATLAKRGIDEAYRERLRGLIAVAQSAEFPVVAEPESRIDGDREAALLELRSWYEDWAETARTVISRREHLILMGLARRKLSMREPDAEATETDEPPATGQAGAEGATTAATAVQLAEPVIA